MDELTEPWGQKVGGGVGEIEKRNESTAFFEVCYFRNVLFGAGRVEGRYKN